MLEPDLGRGFGVCRAEKFFDRRVREHDIRRPLQGFIVTAFESVTFFRRAKHGARFRQEFLCGLHGRVFLILQHHIDAHDKMR